MSATVPLPLPPPPAFDCSDEMQRWRLLMLRNLRDKLYSGVDSLGDRGRSVNYRDDLQELINNLNQEYAACENFPGGRGARGRTRVFFVPYSKWL